MSAQLLTTLKKLRLSGLADSLEVRLHEAAATGLGHREFLELLLQDELLGPQQAAFSEPPHGRRRLPRYAAAWRTSTSASILRSKDRVFDLATGRFVPRAAATCCSWDRREHRQEPLGPSLGTGGDPLARDGLLSFDLRLRANFLHDEALAIEEQILQRYLKPDLLIIDDIMAWGAALPQAQRRVSVRDRAPPPRGQVDAHDQQSAPGGLGQTVGRRAQRHGDTRPVFTPTR